LGALVGRIWGTSGGRRRGIGVTWEDSGDQDALREGISGNMGQQVVGVHGKYREVHGMVSNISMNGGLVGVQGINRMRELRRIEEG